MSLSPWKRRSGHVTLGMRRPIFRHRIVNTRASLTFIASDPTFHQPLYVLYYLSVLHVTKDTFSWHRIRQFFGIYVPHVRNVSVFAAVFESILCIFAAIEEFSFSAQDLDSHRSDLRFCNLFTKSSNFATRKKFSHYVFMHQPQKYSSA